MVEDMTGGVTAVNQNGTSFFVTAAALVVRGKIKTAVLREITLRQSLTIKITNLKPENVNSEIVRFYPDIQ